MTNYEILKKAENTHDLTKEEIVTLLLNNYDNQDLFNAADRVRVKYVGKDVHLRGLIEFSNICSKNCFYCGIRRDNKNIDRYRLEPDNVVKCAKQAAEIGYKTIVLQSGEGKAYSHEEIIYIISEIKKLDVAMTLSIGEKTEQEYKDYKTAGADRFLLRIETTDKELYKKLHPGMSHENRINCLKIIKKLGYETGTGCLIGLPDQTLESLADDILFFKEIGADMIGVGPLICNEDTPLQDYPNGSFELSLKVMAITRLLLPDINIPATTAMETIHPDGRLIALQCGANVVMPNVTESEYKSLYKLYPSDKSSGNDLQNNKSSIIAKINSINRTISVNQGFKRKNQT